MRNGFLQLARNMVLLASEVIGPIKILIGGKDIIGAASSIVPGDEKFGPIDRRDYKLYHPAT